MRLPELHTTNSQLLGIYSNKLCLTANELQAEFGISKTSAYKLIEMSQEHMTPEQIAYARKTIPVDVLFQLYGWNIQSIARRAKMGVL